MPCSSSCARGPDAREHQQLRGVEGAGAEHHLVAGQHGVRPAQVGLRGRVRGAVGARARRRTPRRRRAPCSSSSTRQTSAPVRTCSRSGWARCAPSSRSRARCGRCARSRWAPATAPRHRSSTGRRASRWGRWRSRAARRRRGRGAAGCAATTRPTSAGSSSSCVSRTTSVGSASRVSSQPSKPCRLRLTNRSETSGSDASSRASHGLRRERLRAAAVGAALEALEVAAHPRAAPTSGPR